MCYCNVQTLQTKSTTCKQRKQISQGFAEKSSGYEVGPPKDFEKSTRLVPIPSKSMIIYYFALIKSAI